MAVLALQAAFLEATAVLVVVIVAITKEEEAAGVTLAVLPVLLLNTAVAVVVALTAYCKTKIIGRVTTQEMAR